MGTLKAEVEGALGQVVVESRPLGVGFGLEGLEARLDDGRKVAVKALGGGESNGLGHLAVEAYMLRELARQSDLPVPEVLHGGERLLVMSWIDNDGAGIGPSAQIHAAELLAALHAIKFRDFGYERDTLIGPLHQPNPLVDPLVGSRADRPAGAWIEFFRDHRLLYMAHVAHDAGQLPAALLHRIELLAGKLHDYLIEPAHPCLIHGDCWSGNVLVKGGRIAGFVDPAIYCAHAEIELAFTTMFGTFGRPFFDAYEALNPLEPGFHDLRCGLYNLYPALVHVRLFGAGYLPQVEGTLARLGL